LKKKEEKIHVKKKLTTVLLFPLNDFLADEEGGESGCGDRLVIRGRSISNILLRALYAA
jgi:hypothetical protein